MPRHPAVSPSLGDVGGSVYSAHAARAAASGGEVYPFHVGDTWLEPPEGCRMEDLRTDELPGLHRYAAPRGRADLLGRVAARVAERTGVPTTPDHVLVTTGATGGLGAVLGAIVDPGDDVLVLAPYWPLIVGIVRCFRARPVPVPVPDPAGGPEELLERVRARLGPRTSAIYLGTPNNPTGRVLPRSWLEALAELARREDLWIVADDVYEDYVYAGEHVPARSLAPERTFSAHSVSKAWGMAGNRCGWVVGPAEAMPALAKVGIHAFYSAPTAAQVSAWRALDGRGDRWATEARERYRATGARVARRLGVREPEGSTFLFLDVADRLDGRGLDGFLDACADRGLLLAPGPSFGPYPHHVRLCFTCAPPDVVDRGAAVLADLLGA